MNEIQFSECIICGGGAPPEFAVAAKTHNVRHRGSYRRLCTACLLKTHPGFFCPICFDVYDDKNPLPGEQSVMCRTCPGISHSSCVGPAPTSTSTSPLYRCPPCSNPNFSFFRISECEVVTSIDNAGVESKRVVFTKDLAKQFLAAAKIASVSINKAADMAKIDAEKRAKEAAVARRRAKEALEHYYDLTSKNDKSIDSAKN